MFFPEGQVRVFLYGQPVNMRLSFDGLYALAKHVMHQDPLSGHLFAFINRRADPVKDSICSHPKPNFIYGNLKRSNTTSEALFD
jgi:transposase